ncbi:MAG: hypothetical protein J7M26_09200, partial [Armatimonadetes bacterium]|nr:hypothetical protein [Armatimonadota bacterium]
MSLPPEDVYDVSVGHYCQWPALAVDSRGWVWVAMVANFAERREDGQPLRHFNGLWVKVRGPQRADPELLSSPGDVVWAPAIAAAGEDMWAVWMAWREGRWSLVARRWHDGAWQPAIDLTPAAGHHLHPALAADEAGLWLAWQHMHEGRQQVMLGRLEAGAKSLSSVTALSAELPDSHRPALTLAADGMLWAAWDVYAAGEYRAVAGPVTDGRCAAQVVGGEGVFNGHCSLAAGADGTVWLAWYRRQALDA